MILVTVGTQFFDELIDEVDRLAKKGAFGNQRVLAQIGLSKTPPRHIDFVKFDREMSKRMREAELIITHAGTGSVIEAVESGKPFVAVVNSTKADDHQREFLRTLSTTHDFCWIETVHELEAVLPNARPARAFRPDSVETLANDICRDIDEELSKKRHLRVGKIKRADVNPASY